MGDADAYRQAKAQYQSRDVIHVISWLEWSGAEGEAHPLSRYSEPQKPWVPGRQQSYRVGNDVQFDFPSIYPDSMAPVVKEERPKNSDYNALGLPAAFRLCHRSRGSPRVADR